MGEETGLCVLPKDIHDQLLFFGGQMVISGLTYFIALS